jgi:hypothetical protein
VKADKGRTPFDQAEHGHHRQGNQLDRQEDAEDAGVQPDVQHRGERRHDQHAYSDRNRGQTGHEGRSHFGNAKRQHRRDQDVAD